MPNDRACIFKLLFNGQRWDILSSGCNDKFLESTSDLQIPVLINETHITRVEKSLTIEDLECVLLTVQVAHEYVPTSETNLPDALLIRVKYLNLSSREWFSGFV